MRSGFEDARGVVHRSALQTSERQDGGVAGLDALAELGAHGTLVADHVGVPAVDAVVRLLAGELEAHGTLPVSVTKFSCGDGIVADTPMKTNHILPSKEQPSKAMPNVDPLMQKPASKAFEPLPERAAYKLDSVAKMGIRKGAYPGCQIVAMKDGNVVYDKCFGTFTLHIPVWRLAIRLGWLS